MRDQQNLPAIRPAYVYAPQATNPIPIGSIGEWVDLNGIKWNVSADGSQSAAGQGGKTTAPAARLATAAALPSYVYSSVTQTITASANGVWTIDGKTLNVGDRILKVTTDGATDDGLYVVTVKGTASVKTVLTRASDMSTSGGLVAGLLVPVGPDGDALSGNLYELVTAAGAVLDTTVLEFAPFESIMSGGVIPAARVAFSVNPANNDTITIGGSSFTFKTTLIAATTTTQVKILGSAALTLAALLDAINGVTNANVVANTTPFAALVVADAVTATVLRLRKATAMGGAPVAGTVPSITLAASVTGGAAAWSAANLNVSGRYPKVTITAAMITNGSFQIEMDYGPSSLIFTDTSSAGVLRAVNEAITVSGNTINLVLAGGASPNFQAGDIFNFMAAAS